MRSAHDDDHRLGDGAEILPKVTEAQSAPTEQAGTLGELTGPLTIVSASSRTLEDAEFEVYRAEQEGHAPVLILKRGEYFATTVGDFSDRGEAETLFFLVRADIRDSAYLVNLDTWCPRPVAQDGYFECADE